jgi:hypothetical protein
MTYDDAVKRGAAAARALGLALTIVVLALMLTNASAEACHKFTIWHFTFPQRCSVARPVVRVAQGEPNPVLAKKLAAEPLQEDFPLPSLEGMTFPPDCDADWCQRLKGIGLLRAYHGTN